MILFLSILLLVLMMIVGGDRGAKSFVSLVCNVVILILGVFLITKGINPILITVIGTIVFCQITLLFQNGHNEKTYGAIVAVILVILLLSVMIFVLGSKTKFGGYNELDLSSDLSMYLSPDVNINMNELMVCTIVISLLGAIMDTAMAITSSLYEFNNINNELTTKQLVTMGFNVGRDILGTTVNTIFFASIGESMMISILFIKFKYSLENLINSKAFFQNISLMLLSNIGCLLIIPISIFICVYMLKSNSKVIVKIREVLEKRKDVVN